MEEKNESIVIKISADTSEAIENIDILQEKANRLKNTLSEINSLINSLKGYLEVFK